MVLYVRSYLFLTLIFKKGTLCIDSSIFASEQQWVLSYLREMFLAFLGLSEKVIVFTA